MSKVLIGIAAAIVLAGAVFAIVHFAYGPKPVAVTPQDSWAPVKVAPRIEERDLAGTFGAWRLLCRNIGPGTTGRAQGPVTGNPAGTTGAPAPKHRCSVALLMRNRAAAKEWFNLRFQTPATEAGALAVLFYSYGHAGETFIATPTSLGQEIDLMADKNTASMWTNRCTKGICLAIMQLPPHDVDIILSAHALAIRFRPAKPKKPAEVHIPTEGLKAAFAAMRRQA